jgi:hypothetical protein
MIFATLNGHSYKVALQALVLEYLENYGKVTGILLKDKYKLDFIPCIRTAVKELRRDGYRIHTVYKWAVDSTGSHYTYAEYHYNDEVTDIAEKLKEKYSF